MTSPEPAHAPLDVATFAATVDAPPCPPAESLRPVFVRLAPGEGARFAAACAQRHLAVVDPIERQLADLALVRFPATEAGPARARFVEAAVAEVGDTAAYGLWVYFPWAAQVVHVLDEDAFFEVITNRNQDKITAEEQRFLRTRRIGAVGLSVGAEAAVAVAQEHLCGEIVLADFDRLDLSNLNRLNAGIDELGLPKTTIAARRIARIDPYLKVTVYADGVTGANVDAFLDGLHLLIEECDGLAMKYDLRRLARARGLNIVYAADERGFLSVEPYGDRPGLAPFHGRIPDRPLPKVAYPSPLAFMKALTEWLGGWDAISERSRRSLEQIGVTKCGYPQLASEARYAAGQLGHVARRLLLGERVPPFAGTIDLDDLLPSERDTPAR